MKLGRRRVYRYGIAFKLDSNRTKAEALSSIAIRNISFPKKVLKQITKERRDMGEPIDIPEEFVDFVSQELAYDPVTLSLKEDPTQSLFDRKTLEKIWETKQIATHPLTRRAFDVKDIVHRPDVRARIRDFLKESDTKNCDDRVINDYETPIDSDSYNSLLSKIQRYSKMLHSARKSHNKCARALWIKLNFLRLQIQQHQSVRVLHRDNNGPVVLLRVMEDSFSEEMLKPEGIMIDIAREMAMIHYQLGFNEKALLEASHPSVRALVGLIQCLCQLNYSKIQSKTLAMCRKLFQREEFLDKRLLHYPVRCGSIIRNILMVLSRDNKRELTGRDLANGTQLLKKLWDKHPELVMAFSHHVVGVLADVATLCVSRLRSDTSGSTEKALTRCFYVIAHSLFVKDGVQRLRKLLNDMRFIDTLLEVATLVQDEDSGIVEAHLQSSLVISIYLLREDPDETKKMATSTPFRGLLESDARNKFNQDVQELIQKLEDLLVH